MNVTIHCPEPSGKYVHTMTDGRPMLSVDMTAGYGTRLTLFFNQPKEVQAIIDSLAAGMNELAHKIQEVSHV